jgi:hypothetical protein
VQKKRTRHDYMLYVIKDRVDNADILKKRILFNISTVWDIAAEK